MCHRQVDLKRNLAQLHAASATSQEFADAAVHAHCLKSYQCIGVAGLDAAAGLLWALTDITQTYTLHVTHLRACSEPGLTCACAQ